MSSARSSPNSRGSASRADLVLLLPLLERILTSVDEYADIAALRDVSPHSFRRTVATEIDEVYDAEAAMHHLGHTSKTVTERHYINRRLVVPDYRAATERLAPGPNPSDDPADEF